MAGGGGGGGPREHYPQHAVGCSRGTQGLDRRRPPRRVPHVGVARHVVHHVCVYIIGHDLNEKLNVRGGELRPVQLKQPVERIIVHVYHQVAKHRVGRVA